MSNPTALGNAIDTYEKSGYGAGAQLARAELASLRATVAALTAERDAAYRRGWDDAIQAAAKLGDDKAENAANNIRSNPLSAFVLQNYADDIRALQPTEHDADAIKSSAAAFEKSVKSYVASMEFESDRVKFLHSLGVCLQCGSTYLPCHCTRDE